MWVALQYRHGYKSPIERARTGGGLHRRETRERTGGIATKMSLSVSPCAYFDGPTITFRASFRVVHPWEYRVSPLRVPRRARSIFHLWQFLRTIPPPCSPILLRLRKISIHETPEGHSRDQSCTPYVPGISIRLRPVLGGLGLRFRFWFRARRASRRDVSICTFRANLQDDLRDLRYVSAGVV